MAENTFDIILQAVDNATAEIKKVKDELNNVDKSTKQVTKASEEAGKSVRTQFKEASKELRDFRRTLLLVTVAFATIVATTKEAAKYSKEARDTYREFDVAMKTLSVTIGQLLGPALKGISYIVNILTNVIEAAVAGFIKLGTFITEFFANILSGPVEAFKRAMEVSTIATNDFLNKIEETRARVASGFTLDKENQQIINLEKITVKAALIMRKSWDAVIDALGELGSALSAASEMGRAFGYAAAAVAMGLAIVRTAAGVTRAFQDYPWPFSMIVGGIIAAAGAIQIATIAATKFHEGGLIYAHSGLAVDEVPIIAQTGERILSREQNRAFEGGGYGRQITIQNYIYNPVIRSDEDIDKLTEEISMRLSREAERL